MNQPQTVKRGRGRPRGSKTRSRKATPTPFPDTGYFCEIDPAQQRGTLIRVPEAVVVCPHCGKTGSQVRSTQARFDAGVIERYRECPGCRRTFVTYESNQ